MLEPRVLHNHLKWLVRLRWAASLAILLAAGALTDLRQDVASFLPELGVGAFIALYNSYFSLQLRSRSSQARRSVMLQIVLDQTALAAVLYGTGACHSPFIFFFLFHVVISGILLPYRYTIGVTLLAALFPAAVLAVNHSGLLPRYDLFDHDPAQVNDMATAVTHGAAYLGTLALTAYFTGYLSKQLHDSRRDLHIANRKLSALVESSRPCASLPHLENALSEAFRTVLADRGVKTRIIRIDESMPKIRCHAYYGCTCSSCPAYHTDTFCWHLTGTNCRTSGATAEHCRPRSPARTYQEKMSACVQCDYFAFAISAFTAPKTSVPETRPFPARPLFASAVSEALKLGQVVLDEHRRSALQISSAGLIFPLRVHERISSLLLITSDTNIACSSDTLGFIRVLSELASSGLLSADLIGNIEASYLQTVMALANAIEAKDPYTRGHSERVAASSRQIADALGLTPEEKEHITFGAILHDVGKIGITPDILRKEDRLARGERDDMESHAAIGAKILEPVRFLKPALDVIRHHHENYDGSGYPGGLQGTGIPFKARIVKVADAWDAMMTDRPYRKAMAGEEAIDELRRNAGTQFDPQIVGIFLDRVVRMDRA